MFQFIDIELIRIRFKNSLPSCQTYDGNGINVRMHLKTFQCVDYDWTTIDMQKLLGNVLPHTATGTASD